MTTTVALSLVDYFIDWAGMPQSSRSSFRGWDFVPHFRGGELVAIAAILGTEIHFAIRPSWRKRLIQRQAAREFLRPLLHRWGFLTTRAARGDTLAPEFLKRLGFSPTWTDGQFDHYMLTALPFRRK